jgi:hypothetical protein
MSLDYDLEMATALSLDQFAREAVDVARELSLVEAVVAPEQIVSDGATTALGTWVKVYAPAPPPWAPEVIELGITATLSISFELSDWPNSPVLPPPHALLRPMPRPGIPGRGISGEEPTSKAAARPGPTTRGLERTAPGVPCTCPGP